MAYIATETIDGIRDWRIAMPGRFLTEDIAGTWSDWYVTRAAARRGTAIIERDRAATIMARYLNTLNK